MIRALLIEDNIEDAEFICSIFRRTKLGGKIVWTKTLQEGIQRLEIESFDVVLTDLSLPDASGLQAVTAVRRAAEYVSIVVLTDLVDNTVAESAIEESAQDYLIKDLVTADSLERSIRYAFHRQEARNDKLRMLHSVEHIKNLLKNKNRRLKRLYTMAQEFVDHVSHEFRTPLSVIKDYVSIISDGVVGTLNDEQRRMLELVDDRADDLNTMVDDMLDASKLNAGLLDVWRKECTVEGIIQQVLPSIERKAITRKAVLRLHLEAGLPPVYCDAEKAGRVIVNLCLNAIKSAGEGCEIELWSRVDAGHDNVLVGVTDSGPGMSQKCLRKIFKRFTQTEAGLRTDVRGFGLRLNIAAELAKLNFGQMSVASEMGKGSTFSFTLPVALPRNIVARCLNQLETNRHHATTVSLLLAYFDERPGESLSNDADRFLNFLLRRNDLMFRSGEFSWLLLLPLPTIELQSFLDRADQLLGNTNRYRPLAPLPQINYKVLGTWSPGSGNDEILTTVDQFCSPPALTLT
jgi:signal transduction histidine kinase